MTLQAGENIGIDNLQRLRLVRLLVALVAPKGAVEI